MFTVLQCTSAELIRAHTAAATSGNYIFSDKCHSSRDICNIIDIIVQEWILGHHFYLFHYALIMAPEKVYNCMYLFSMHAFQVGCSHTAISKSWGWIKWATS